MTVAADSVVGERGPADLWRALRRRWIVVVCCLVAAIGLALWYTAWRQPVYAATATFLVEDRGGTAEVASDMRLQAEISLFESDAFEKTVAERLDVAVAPPVDSVEFTGGGLVEVTVRAESSEFASTAANAYVDVFQDTRRERIGAAFERAAAALQEPINDVEARLAGLDPDDALAVALLEELTRLTDRRNAVLLELAVDSGEMTIVTPATPPSDPDQISGAALVVMAAVAGLLLGCAIAFVLQFFDRKVRTADDVVRVIGPVPVYAIPRDGRLRGGPRLHPDLRGAAVEALRDVRSAVHGRQVMVFTGVSRRCGTTTIVCNLAALFAAAGRRVVVVDLAVVDPRVARVFDVLPMPGAEAGTVREAGAGVLDAWHAGSSEMFGDVCVVSVAWGRPGITTGDVVAGLDLGKLVKALRDDFDLVLIDSTAVTVSAACLPVAAIADAVVLVAGRSEAERDLRRAWTRLHAIDVEVAAVVPCGIGKSLRSASDSPSGRSRFLVG